MSLVLFIGGPWHGELKEFEENKLSPQYNVVDTKSNITDITERRLDIVPYQLRFKDLSNGQRAYIYVYNP